MTHRRIDPHQASLENALRRALWLAADSVEPAADGLDRIRAKISARQRAGRHSWTTVYRVRASAAAVAAFEAVIERFRPDPGRSGRLGWLRPAAALATAMFVVASASWAISALPQAISSINNSASFSPTPGGTPTPIGSSRAHPSRGGIVSPAESSSPSPSRSCSPRTGPAVSPTTGPAGSPTSSPTGSPSGSPTGGPSPSDSPTGTQSSTVSPSPEGTGIASTPSPNAQSGPHAPPSPRATTHTSAPSPKASNSTPSGPCHQK